MLRFRTRWATILQPRRWVTWRHLGWSRSGHPANQWRLLALGLRALRLDRWSRPVQLRLEGPGPQGPRQTRSGLQVLRLRE